MLEIIPISAFQDNYIWVLQNPENKNCVVVDPGDATPVITYLEQHKLALAAILITHHHHDHTQGIAALQQLAAVPIYGPHQENILGVNVKVKETDTVVIPSLSIEFTVYEIPGHTKGHIAYYAPGILFCGDTLFSAGCGRLFEGTAEQMYESLAKIASLPPDTLLYCAHEYTAANLRFAQMLEPDNQAIQQRSEEVAILRKSNHATLPTKLSVEMQINPFLRCHLASIKKSASAHAGREITDPVEVFQVIRQWKNGYVGTK